MPAVMLISLSMTGCATDKAAFSRAQADKARAGQVEVALAAAEKSVQQARLMPLLPSECRKTWKSGVQLGDRLDVAAKKGDIALGGANKQIAGCAAWYDRTRMSRQAKP